MLSTRKIVVIAHKKNFYAQPVHKYPPHAISARLKMSRLHVQYVPVLQNQLIRNLEKRRKGNTKSHNMGTLYKITK